MSSLNYKAEKLNLQFYSSYQAKRNFEDLAFEEQGKDEIYAKDANGNNYSPSWYTINLKGMYVLTKTFSVNAGVENITDQRYRLYSSGISAPGRNYVLSFRADF
jgi:hemoglobin/transferrin/lactoferrin receptor protein